MLARALSQLFFALAFLLAGSGLANAGSFQVSPVRATLSPGRPVSSQTLYNTGSEPLTLQLETMGWSQQQGKDVYTPTREILVTPLIFTMPAGGSQRVRVGLRRGPVAQRELTYRLFMQEVPQSKPGFHGLQKILRIGVPVFIPPAAEQPPVLAWRIYRTREGRLEVSLTNNGNAHVKVANLSLVNVDGGELGKQQIAAYVLSGQRGNWLIRHIPAPAQGTRLQVIAQTDIGEINGGVINVKLK